MDAVQLIRSDHEKVKNLFQDWLMAPAAQPERRRQVAEKIIQELMVHERIEEELFYPAFRVAMGDKGEEEVEHSKEEHLLVDTLIAQLEVLDPDAPDFEATMKVLIENVEHHIQDEEEKMLPAARQWMAPQLEPLGREMMEYKEALTRQARTPAPREGERQVSE